MKNTFKHFGIVTLIVIIVIIAACGDGDGGQEFSFYGQIFNEKTKNAVRERKGMERSVFIIDGDEIDLFQLFELNNKWTWIHKDKPTDPEYVHLIIDNSGDPDYLWYRDEPGNPDGEKRYWRDYHITSAREVTDEFYNRIMSRRYGNPHYWTQTGDDNSLIWFTVNKFLDTNKFSVSIGLGYGDKGIQSSNITLDDVDDIIIEF